MGFVMSRRSEGRPDRHSERSETYGDHDFKGLGITLCHNCGEPTRDHPLEPCRRKPKNAVAVIAGGGKLPRKTRPREGLDKK
jgi:hypothetical protein